MTLEEKLARLLACAVYQLGGSLHISNSLLDNMKGVRLVLDETSEPKMTILATISNEVITLATIDSEDAVEVS